MLNIYIKMKEILLFMSIALVSMTSCAVAPPESVCVFNNQTYLNGQTIDSACFVMICNSGQWNFTRIDQKCALCDLVDDPHILTFDQYYYDWQEKCNYSIAQYFVCENTDDSYNASYGIYGDFIDCLGGIPGATCLYLTTYKAFKHTAITFIHDEVSNDVDMKINEILTPLTSSPATFFPHPIIAWKVGHTIRIVGPDFCIATTGTHLMIYAQPSKKYQLGGLCGNYTGIIEPDERTSRTCIPEPTILPFASSWATLEQNPDDGDECIVIKEIPEPPPCDEENKYRDYCEENMAQVFRDPNCGKPTEEIRKIAIENCVKDCCAIPELCEQFMKVAKNFICDLGINNALTVGGADGSNIKN